MKTEHLIDQLCLPESYPHNVDVITTIETHISVVFLTGEFAYKLKKPVDFGFLNFTQLANRKHFYAEELRLNARTAPELYLEVVPLYESQGVVRFSPFSTEQKPFEYLVKMRQFDPNQVLGRYLKEEGLQREQEKQLAQTIAELHQHAAIVAMDSHLGEPKTILQPMLDNFPTLYRECNKDLHPRLDQLQAWTYAQFKQHKTFISERKAKGFVRECHGDLHLDNITMIQGVPTLFDGIEFNDEFRWIDGISDLAFLLVDLEFRGQTGFRNRVLSHYLQINGDYSALRLLNFYQVYRSLVRAKISALRLSQLDENSQEFLYYRQLTLQYVELAERIAFSKAPAQMILLQGLSGSGKSHFAQNLLEHTNAVVISSDIERKRLYGIAPTFRISEAEKTKLYSAEMSRQTYQRLNDLALQCLQDGFSVMVDATFLKHAHRVHFYQMATNAPALAKLIYLSVSESIAQKAIEARLEHNQDASDADVEVMKRQALAIQTPRKTEPALTLDADQLRHHFPLQIIQDFLQPADNNSNQFK